MKKNHNIIILIIVSIIVIIISTTGIFKKNKIDNNFNHDLHAETKKILKKLDDKIYVNIYLKFKLLFYLYVENCFNYRRMWVYWTPFCGTYLCKY